MTFQYKGRKLDSACLLRITKQFPIISVEITQLNFIGLNTESSELLVHPNGDKFDVLAGKAPEPEALSKKQKLKGEIAVRLVSKQMLKKVEDITVNGCEMAPPPEPEYRRPYEPRPYEGRRDNNYGDRDRGYHNHNDRPAYRPAGQGAPYRPQPQGAPHAPAPIQRPAQPAVAPLMESSTGQRIKAALFQAPLQAQPKPLETADSHRPISGQYAGNNRR